MKPGTAGGVFGGTPVYGVKQKTFFVPVVITKNDLPGGSAVFGEELPVAVISADGVG